MWMDKRTILSRQGWQKAGVWWDMEITLRVGAYYEVWYNPACMLQHIIPERRTTKKYLQQ